MSFCVFMEIKDICDNCAYLENRDGSELLSSIPRKNLHHIDNDSEWFSFYALQG